MLKHWACAKIARTRPSATGTGKDAELGDEEEVCAAIVEKFEQVGSIDVSYADIAKRAWELGRTGLATKVWTFICSVVTFSDLVKQLLDHETKASDQVPLLLTMKEDRLALNKAVDSGDTDMGMFSSPSLLPLVDLDTKYTTYCLTYTTGFLWAHSFN